jgi:cell division septation protein DedD
MDRVLLERMVGAAVLVLLFVVFAPMLLDGREEFSSENAADSSSSVRTKVIVLNKQPEATGKPVQVRPAKQQPRPAPEAQAPSGSRAKPAAEAPGQGFAVQVGSFSSRENAVSFAGSLRAAGFAVFVVRGSATAGSVYRVYAGPKETRKEAEALAKRLAAEGQSVMIVDLAGRQGD